MKKTLALLMALMMTLSLASNVLALAPAKQGTIEPHDNLIYSFDFEENPFAEGWTTIDSDGDGQNWGWAMANSVYPAYSGGCYMRSDSYNAEAGGALTPDNWLIGPSITIPSGRTTITWYAIGQHSDYCEEVFGLYVGAQPTVAAMTQVGSD